MLQVACAWIEIRSFEPLEGVFEWWIMLPSSRHRPHTFVLWSAQDGESRWWTHAHSRHRFGTKKNEHCVAWEWAKTKWFERVCCLKCVIVGEARLTSGQSAEHEEKGRQHVLAIHRHHRFDFLLHVDRNNSRMIDKVKRAWKGVEAGEEWDYMVMKWRRRATCRPTSLNLTTPSSLPSSFSLRNSDEQDLIHVKRKDQIRTMAVQERQFRFWRT